MLPASSRTAAAKYVSIVASNMSDSHKIAVIETMLVAEADVSLKTFIQDHLEDMVSVEQLHRNLLANEDDA